MTRRSTAACAPIIAVRCRVRSVACGVACSPWAVPYASTDWLGRHQAGPSFVFCRPSLMFAGAYLLGFGRAISLKEPPCGLGPLQIRILRGRRGELQYSRAQTRHSPGYSLETAPLLASKRLHIDQLNAEMGAPPLVETPAPWLAWSAPMSGGPRPRETPCRVRA